MLKEPRGFSGMLGSVLTEPCHPDADIGVIYLWTDGYFSACGDSTYSCSAALVNTGMIEVKEPVTNITFDTVSGLVKTKVEVEDGNAKRIFMEGVPSFYWKTMKFNVPDVGEVEADIAFGGLWYAFIDADSIGLKPLIGEQGYVDTTGLEDQELHRRPDQGRPPRVPRAKHTGPCHLLHEAKQGRVHE